MLTGLGQVSAQWTQALARMGRNSDWDWGGTEAVINRIAGEENSLEQFLKVIHITILSDLFCQQIQ